MSKGMPDEAVDAILKGMDSLDNKHGKRFDSVDSELAEVKHQLRDLKHDTPEKKDFDELKARVDRHHPLS